LKPDPTIGERQLITVDVEVITNSLNSEKSPKRNWRVSAPACEKVGNLPVGAAALFA